MSTTPAIEYNMRLAEIQDHNLFREQVLDIPESETIYEVDLDKRTIKVPGYLGVASDHESETIYFKFSRYFDGWDLSRTTCVIQYINANDEGGIYPVPYYDTTKFDGMMVIPWCISGLVSAAPGTIQFSIRFYIVDTESKKLLYNLNTQVAKSKLYPSLDLTEELAELYHVDADVLSQVYNALRAFAQSNAWDWIEIPSETPVDEDALTLQNIKE